MVNNMRVKKGDSTDIFEITIEGLTDYTDYRGEVTILNPADDTEVFPKIAIAPANNKITVAFSPVHTSTLDVGEYNVVCEVIKETDGVVQFRRELSWPIEVLPSLINN